MIQSIIDQQDAEINNLRADLTAAEAELYRYYEDKAGVPNIPADILAIQQHVADYYGQPVAAMRRR